MEELKNEVETLKQILDNLREITKNQETQINALNGMIKIQQQQIKLLVDTIKDQSEIEHICHLT